MAAIDLICGWCQGHGVELGTSYGHGPTCSRCSGTGFMSEVALVIGHLSDHLTTIVPLATGTQRQIDVEHRQALGSLVGDIKTLIDAFARKDQK